MEFLYQQMRERKTCNMKGFQLQSGEVRRYCHHYGEKTRCCLSYIIVSSGFSKTIRVERDYRIIKFKIGRSLRARGWMKKSKVLL